MELLELVKEAVDKVRAYNVEIYDLRGISPLNDYTVIATVDSQRQASAVMEYLYDFQKEHKFDIRGVEGKDSTWVLVDLYDIVLHVFTPEERKNYDLDRLFVNCPKVK